MARTQQESQTHTLELLQALQGEKKADANCVLGCIGPGTHHGFKVKVHPEHSQK